MSTTQGNFPLTGTKKLPNVTVAFPGEHWSDGKANETITPGEAVIPVSSGKTRVWKRASSAEASSRRLHIALRCVQNPDVNTGPLQEGPNEIMSKDMPKGEYVHAYFSGAFNLTLVKPDTAYEVGQLLTWDPAATRPAGKSAANTGAWKKTTNEAVAKFEVLKVNYLNATTGEALLVVRSLEGQF